MSVARFARHKRYGPFPWRRRPTRKWERLFCGKRCAWSGPRTRYASSAMRSAHITLLSFVRWKDIDVLLSSPPKCNGCGFCEQRCPVKGDSAIVVMPNGEIRLKEGSYIKEAKKLELEFKPDPGDDKFILEESGFKVEEKKEGERSIPPKKKPQPKKPKGFL